jgi:hypothetical protein
MPAIAPILPVGGGFFKLTALALRGKYRRVKGRNSGCVGTAVLRAVNALNGVNAQFCQARRREGVVAVNQDGALAPFQDADVHRAVIDEQVRKYFSELKGDEFHVAASRETVCHSNDSFDYISIRKQSLSPITLPLSVWMEFKGKTGKI